MLRDLKKNNRGIIFVTVLIIIIVSMILAISVLSLNISQVKSVENELKSVQAKLLADGGLAIMVVNQMSGSPGNGQILFSETSGNTTYDVTATVDGGGASPGDYTSVPLTIDVAF